MTLERGIRLLLVVVAGIVLSTVVLFLVNEVLRGWIGADLPFGLAGDLVFAAAVYFVAAWGWFRLAWRRDARPVRRSLVAAATVTLLFIVVLPLAASMLLDRREEVALPGPLPSQLDVAIITAGAAGRDAPATAPRPAPALWDVRYSVGRADAAGVRWQLLDTASAQEALTALAEPGAGVPGSPGLRAGGDAVLLLDPDAAPPLTPAPERVPDKAPVPGEVARWRAIVAAADLRPMPTFALLRTGDEDRLASWRAWLAETGGDAVSLQQLGQRSVTDAAIQLGADAPSADADLALAYKHRPLLYFASRERNAEPMDVDAFFASERVQLCDDGDDGACSLIKRASELRNGRTHLRVDLKSPASSSESVVYVHVSHSQQVPGRVHLDYWWYLPYNHNPVADNSFCGPGFTIVGLTCHEHQSDWEGIILDVDTTRDVPIPTAVRFAQHSAVAEYDWPDLRRLWRSRNYVRFTEGIDDATQRPVVLVARGSHAAYPRLCGGGCEQPSNGVPEGVHDGARGWVKNTDRACALVCVRMTPTRSRGTAPALWNAFEGPWGERHCLLAVWCDVGGAPTAPGMQDRYRDPAHSDLRGPLPDLGSEGTRSEEGVTR